PMVILARVSEETDCLLREAVGGDRVLAFSDLSALRRLPSAASAVVVDVAGAEALNVWDLLLALGGQRRPVPVALCDAVSAAMVTMTGEAVRAGFDGVIVRHPQLTTADVRAGLGRMRSLRVLGRVVEVAGEIYPEIPADAWTTAVELVLNPGVSGT